jgi:hypothetical protein
MAICPSDLGCGKTTGVHRFCSRQYCNAPFGQPWTSFCTMCHQNANGIVSAVPPTPLRSFSVASSADIVGPDTHDPSISVKQMATSALYMVVLLVDGSVAYAWFLSYAYLFVFASHSCYRLVNRVIIGMCADKFYDRFYVGALLPHQRIIIEITNNYSN